MNSTDHPARASISIDAAADALWTSFDDSCESFPEDHAREIVAAILETGWTLESAARASGDLGSMLPGKRDAAIIERQAATVLRPWETLTGDTVPVAVGDAFRALRRALLENVPSDAGVARYVPLDLSSHSGEIAPVGYAPGDLARRFIYGEGLTTFIGKSEAGKSKLGQRLAIDSMYAGRTVAHFDWEQGEDDAIGTYRKLGVPLALLQARLHYFWEPDALQRAALDALATDHPGMFVFVDSMSRAADAAGLSGTEWAGHAKIASDLNAFGMTKGCPVLLLDHLGRDAGKTTRHGVGATGKLNAARGQWNIAREAAFSESKAGRIVATNVKARSGGLAPYFRFGVGGDGADRIEFCSLDAGEVPALKIELDVIEFLRDAGVAQSLNAIEKGVKGNAEVIRKVVKDMAAEPDGPVRAEHTGAHPKYAR